MAYKTHGNNVEKIAEHVQTWQKKLDAGIAPQSRFGATWRPVIPDGSILAHWLARYLYQFASG